jgi:TM2 domain-containing membrane protein YozV
MTNFCSHCGAALDPNASFCSQCGTAVYQQTAFASDQNQRPFLNSPAPQYGYPPPNLPNSYNIQPIIIVPQKNKTVAALLAIFLGSFGIHKFYLGNHCAGILYLCFCWTYIPGFIGFLEGIIYLCKSEENFQRDCVIHY